jgi:hypothetical protein
MRTLIELPTDDPRMRAFRLAGPMSGRPVTIHDIVRRRAIELHRTTRANRRGEIVLPWIATR